MGKRGRRKQREGTSVERPTAPPRASQRSPVDFPDADVLLDAFWDAQDEQQFERALAEHPALLSPDYERALARMTSAEELLDAVDRLAPQAQAAGMMIDYGRLQGLRGEALLRLPTVERAQAVDEALECLVRAREYAESADDALERTMQIGLATAERLHGDRAENVEGAVRILSEAVESISPETEPAVTCRLGWVPSQDSRRLGRRPGYARTECASPWTTTSTSTSRWTSTASRKQPPSRVSLRRRCGPPRRPRRR